MLVTNDPEQLVYINIMHQTCFFFLRITGMGAKQNV